MKNKLKFKAHEINFEPLAHNISSVTVEYLIRTETTGHVINLFETGQLDIPIHELLNKSKRK